MGCFMRPEIMTEGIDQGTKVSVNPVEMGGGRVERIDVMPAFLDEKQYGRIRGIIPQEYVTATLSGGLSREFNPIVVGSSRVSPSSGLAYEPTTREADFLEREDLPKPIDVVDAIGSTTANFFDSYEAIYGPDRLARLKAISRGGGTARLPGPQRIEDEEVLTDIDNLLAMIRRFAAGGRTEAAQHFANTSRRIVERHGRLAYEVQPDKSVKRTIVLPEDKRVREFHREPLEAILPKLSIRNSSAYQILARAHKLFGDAAVRAAIRTLPIV